MHIVTKGVALFTRRSIKAANEVIVLLLASNRLNCAPRIIDSAVRNQKARLNGDRTLGFHRTRSKRRFYTFDMRER